MLVADMNVFDDYILSLYPFARIMSDHAWESGDNRYFHCSRLGMGKKIWNRRTEPEPNQNTWNRNQTETLKYPNAYYISISKITELRTERIPEYIKIIIIYTFCISL